MASTKMSRNGSPKASKTQQRLSERRAVRLAEHFAILKLPMRLRVLELCGERPRGVTELCRDLGVEQPSMSNHMARLRLEGAVKGRRNGKHINYELEPLGQRLLAAIRILDHEEEVTRET